MFNCEKATGASQSSLNFIDDKQGPIAAAEFRGALEIIFVWHVHALALDRLDDEGRHRAWTQYLLECEQIVERDADTVGQQGPKAAAEYVITIERQCTIGQAVECMVAVDDAGPPGCRSRKLNGRLDRFCARICEKYFVEVGYACEQPLGQNASER